jgi:hypothetical protein
MHWYALPVRRMLRPRLDDCPMAPILVALCGLVLRLLRGEINRQSTLPHSSPRGARKEPFAMLIIRCDIHG